MTYVTVALNNGELLKALAIRRGILEKIKFLTGGENTSECQRALNVDEPMVSTLSLRMLLYLSSCHTQAAHSNSFSTTCAGET